MNFKIIHTHTHTYGKIQETCLKVNRNEKILKKKKQNQINPMKSWCLFKLKWIYQTMNSKNMRVIVQILDRKPAQQTNKNKTSEWVSAKKSAFCGRAKILISTKQFLSKCNMWPNHTNDAHWSELLLFELMSCRARIYYFVVSIFRIIILNYWDYTNDYCVVAYLMNDFLSTDGQTLTHNQKTWSLTCHFVKCIVISCESTESCWLTNTQTNKIIITAYDNLTRKIWSRIEKPAQL